MENLIPPISCPQCGNPIPAGAPGGHCPRCLMAAVNVTTQPPLDASEVGSSEPGSSGMGSSDPASARSAKEPPKAPSVEQLAAALPQLEILELIGQGGMGCVYKARQPKLDRLVAVKVLPQGYEEDPAFAARFEREARALAALGHPNIVTIHDFGQSGGFYYLLMEYVDGVNLRQLMRSRKLSPQEALAVVPPLCEALQFAHDRGIVHRDIKPENLLLDKTGRIKIADFGIAKMLGTEPGWESEKIAGTPRYMAPEQKFASSETDHRSDIYSLGVVLYEMLTGELPSSRIEPPSRRVQIDVRLDEIVLKALEKTPELRYQSATDLRTKVETVMSEESPSGKPSDNYFRRVVGQSKAYLGTQETLSTFTGQFFHFRRAGEVVLDEKQLTVVSSQKTWSIPLKAIRDVSLGNYPRAMNIFRLELIRLVFQADGKTETLFIAPFEGASKWSDMIRAEVTQSTGKTPTLTPADQLGFPPASPLLVGIIGLALTTPLILFWFMLRSRIQTVEPEQGILVPPPFGYLPEILVGIALGGVGLFAFFNQRTKKHLPMGTTAPKPISPLRRLACGLIGFLVPILPMLVYSKGISQTSRLDTDFQSRKMDLFQKEAAFRRNLEIANQKMTLALVDARNARDSQNAPQLKEVADSIEKLTGQQQAARLDMDRVFQQKTFLERHPPQVSPALGWGVALIACTLLVTLYLMAQATIPLQIPIATLLVALGVSFGTLRMNQSEQDMTLARIEQTTRKSVGFLPGEPGRYGPTFATWNSVFSAGHPTSSYTASIGLQAQCMMTVRTLIKQGTATFEIPGASFLVSTGLPFRAHSLSFRWEPKLNPKGEPVLALVGFGNGEVQKEVPISGIPAKLVWNAVNPDPMNLMTYQQPNLMTYLEPPLPLSNNSGNFFAGNALRFPILMGQDPTKTGSPVEIQVEWRALALDKSAMDREETIQRMGTMDLASAGDSQGKLPVMDVIPNHLVTMIRSGSGADAPSQQYTWRVTGASQRLVKIRWGTRSLSGWMEREPNNGPFAMTINAKTNSRESSGGPETNLQLELNTGSGTVVRNDNWVLPGIGQNSSSPSLEKGPQSIWQYQPLELLQSSNGGLILELCDHDDLPNTPKTASLNHPPTEKEIQVIAVGSQTDAKLQRSSWLISSKVQRYATIRYRDRAFKVALAKYPDSNRFEATLTVVQQFQSPTEMNVVWLIQRPGDFEFRETWNFSEKELDHFKSGQGEFPNPESPIELFKGGKGSLMLSLTEDDPALKPLVQTPKGSNVPPIQFNDKGFHPKRGTGDENTISVFKIKPDGPTRQMTWVVSSDWPATLRVRHKSPNSNGNTWGLPLIKDPFTGQFTATIRSVISPPPQNQTDQQKIEWFIQAPQEQEKRRSWILVPQKSDEFEIVGGGNTKFFLKPAHRNPQRNQWAGDSRTEFPFTRADKTCPGNRFRSGESGIGPICS